jgi:antitoxin VapB
MAGALRYTYAIYNRPGGTVGTSSVFTNNRTQAVRLPSELRLPESVTRVSVRARGKERIIAPLESSWDSFFVDGPVVSDDFLETRASQDQGTREPL